MARPARSAVSDYPSQTLPVSRLELTNLTVFEKVSFDFSKALYVIVGSNGSGKTDLLKIIYCIVNVLGQPQRRPGAALTKSGLQGLIADKLIAVFRPEALGRLLRRHRGRQRSEVRIAYGAVASWLLISLLTVKLSAEDSAEQELEAKSVLASDIKVLLHLGQPSKKSKLFPGPIDEKSVKQKLRERLKAVGRYPGVKPILGHGLPWMTAHRGFVV